MIFNDRQLISKRIGSWSKLLKLVSQLTPQGKWIFRALNDTPKGNNLEVLSHFDLVWRRRQSHTERKLYEAWMLREFRREAYHYLQHLPNNDDKLEWLALCRHYGMPVRLVDFTYSFYVAAYFAIARKIKDQDGWILAFNHEWHKQQLEKMIEPLVFEFEIPFEEAAVQDPRVFHMLAMKLEKDYVVAVNSFRRNPRLAAQQGLFLCPTNIEKDFDLNLEGALPEQRVDKLKLIKIPSKIRKEVIDDLRRMNINSASLFRDLSGWAESQGDLVYKNIEDERFIKELKLEIDNPR